MKRLACVLLLLLAGAIASWAIAWACAAWSDPERGRPTLAVQAAGSGRSAVTCRRAAFGHARTDQCVYEDFQMNASGDSILMARAALDGSEQSVSMTGWPWRCLQCSNRAEITIRTSSGSMMGISKTGLTLDPDGIELPPFANPLGGSSWRALPLRPLWTGMILDASFFATIGWLLLFGGSLIRRRLRLRRGLCAWCAYPTGASPVCTECGRPVGWKPPAVTRPSC